MTIEERMDLTLKKPRFIPLGGTILREANKVATNKNPLTIMSVKYCSSIKRAKEDEAKPTKTHGKTKNCINLWKYIMLSRFPI